MTAVRALVAAGTALSVAGAAHAAVNARLLRRPVPGDRPLPPLTVLIPARDEAATIAACVESVQGPWDVVVLDDESADGTAGLARSAGARVIAGRPVPPGWVGKVWACAQLAQAAAATSEVLVFVDADVRLEPDAVHAAVALLLDTGLDVVCPFPRQQAVTPAERLVQPLLQWSWLTFLPLRAMERSPRPSLAAAGGQWLIADRAGYLRAGGHAAVRDDVLEDIGLARAVKRSGGRIALADGSRLATCRMYDSWSELTAGYSKSLWASFGSPTGAAAVVVTLIILYAVPPVAALVLAVAGAVQPALVALTAYALGVVGRVVAGTATGARTWPDALGQPVSTVVFGWLVARSFRLRRRGLLSWRGRAV
jgi:hypothetical protein